MGKKQYLYKQIITWFLSAGMVIQPCVSLGQVTTVVPDKGQINPARVSESASGVAVVDIRRPNEKGLSHNRYEELQVGDKGLIFNNSNKMVETKLAGFIKGNPALVGTQAKTILNEVVGQNPTAIRGGMEVAGAKANLIIANPNGLYVNNGSFINTDRAILTTGVPVVQEGELTDVAVRGGKVEIAGQGLDAKSVSKTEVLAQAVAINAGLWSDTLRVVTGTNKVGVTTDVVTKLGEHEEVGLDVSAIGGMYANRIVLVGTEKGLGVNIDGTINALNGNVTLTTEGKVSMSGALVGHDKVSVTAKEVAIGKTGALGGAGTVITAEAVTNQGLIGNTDVTKDTTISAKTVTNEQGKIVSDGKLHIEADTIHNERGTITSGSSLSVKSTTLLNEEGTIGAKEEVTLQSKQIDNAKGNIFGGKGVEIHADSLKGANQTITSGADITVVTKEDLVVSGGIIVRG